MQKERVRNVNKMSSAGVAGRKLDGRVAIVTGASRGIGRAVARVFAEEGAKVVANYYSSTGEAEALRDEIERIGGDCMLFRGDVSRAKDVKEMVGAALAKYGRIDILVNNAGIIFRKK